MHDKVVNNCKHFEDDLSGEDGWEAAVAKCAPVQQQWVFAMGRKMHIGTLALQRSSQ